MHSTANTPQNIPDYSIFNQQLHSSHERKLQTKYQNLGTNFCALPQQNCIDITADVFAGIQGHWQIHDLPTLKLQKRAAWETLTCMQHTFTQPTTVNYPHNLQICIRNKNLFKIHSLPLTSARTPTIKCLCELQIDAKYTASHHVHAQHK